MKFKKNILLLMMLTLSAPSFASGDDEIIKEETQTETEQDSSYLDEFKRSCKIAATIGGIGVLVDYLLVELEINPWEESVLEKCGSGLRSGVYSLINRIKK